jgi:hypothetical protein
MLRFSDSRLYSQCGIQSARSETENLRFDSGERKGQRLHHVGFGAHENGGCHGYLTGSETSWTRNLSPICRGYRIGKRVNMLIPCEFPNFRRYVVRVFVFCKLRVVGLVVGYRRLGTDMLSRNSGTQLTNCVS